LWVAEVGQYLKEVSGHVIYKKNGEAIGIPLLITGCIALLVAFILTFMGKEALYAVGLALVLWSVSLGLTAVGTAHS